MKVILSICKAIAWLCIAVTAWLVGRYTVEYFQPYQKG